ncbi:hypothetical protein AAFF_G00159030 [Aldrovandia affinis]|uniref:Diaphanous-related formin 3 n=1 Tax=Aldrovandia affinis TaxID=143900 RepID=A0AAD7RNF1_9TELE|nr:hypothetical protein AAFF_G00159030 [Aldrovandia affinis]
MENYQQRENKFNRKKCFPGGTGTPAHGSWGSEEAEKKPKFLDRFASIRIPGSRKERPHLSHVKHSASSDWAASSEYDDLSTKITSEKEILALFEKMMEDMNLNEDKKAPLREKELNMKKEMVIQYVITASKTGGLRSRHQAHPHEFLVELKSGVADERLIACLDSLRVSLTSNPVSWVQSFGHEGLGLLLDTLERLLHKKHPEHVDRRSQHKVIQCLKAFMNNKYGLERILSEEKSLTLLAQALDPSQPAMMTDAVKLLSAICIVGEENTLEKVLEAITGAGERKGVERFSPIVEGLRDRSVQLQVSCMQLINALVTSPDELDFRLHIRNELMRCGLRDVLPRLSGIRSEALDIQLRVHEEHREEDLLEFSHRLEDIKSELDDVGDVFSMVLSGVRGTAAEGHFLSILQHLLLVRNDYFIRPQYFRIIEECVSQIVLHRSGTDPDFSYRKRLDVDFSHLIDVCVDKARADEFEQRASTLEQKFDEEFLGRQEADAQLLKRDERIGELEAELQAFRSQFGAPPVGGVSSAHPIPFPASFAAQPKKEFKPEISMKRLNWSKIRPQEMSESCFWIMANEDKYENADLLTRLACTFGSQKLARREEELDETKCLKKRIKQLRVLDAKMAQNLSIFLGSFRMPYQEIRRIVLEVDEEQLTEPMIQNLVKHLPEQEQLNALVKYKQEYASLSEPEQFGVVMSSVKRLRPRLSSILFRLQFDEQVNNIRPDVLAVSSACEELRRSKGFGTLLELVLLIGNYMNAGSRNAQSYGFDLSSLCKLKDTKSADQKQTLLHFLAEVCEERFPDVLRFVEDLQHVDRASRVSAENLERNLKQMERQIVQLEKDLETFACPAEPQDMFVAKMSISFTTGPPPRSPSSVCDRLPVTRHKSRFSLRRFSLQAREQHQKLLVMHGTMDTLYQNMVLYFAIDPKKTSVEEFFTDMSNFRAMFMQAVRENVRRREAEEKQRRVRAAKEKAEREKQERQQKKKRLLEVNTENDETGVMDSLLEALQSGAAFRDRRKRVPRTRDGGEGPSPSSQRPVLKPCNHENQKTPLQRSRSRQNINFPSSRGPIGPDLNYEADPHSSAAHGKASARREGRGGAGRERDRERERDGEREREREREREGQPVVCPSNGESDVEALLARLRAL